MSNKQKSFQERLAQRQAKAPVPKERTDKPLAPVTGNPPIIEMPTPVSNPLTDALTTAVKERKHYWVMTMRYHMDDEVLVGLAKTGKIPDVLQKDVIDISMTCVLCVSSFKPGMAGTICTPGR